MLVRCRRFKDAAAGSAFSRWELGFNQSRFGPAYKTCGTLHYILSRLAAFLPCYFPLWVSPPGWGGVLKGVFALNLLPLWGYHMCTEVAHLHVQYSIECGLTEMVARDVGTLRHLGQDFLGGS